MRITTFLCQYTNMPAATLFDGPGRKGAIQVQHNADDSYSFPLWSLTGVPEPTPAQIATALAAPEPGPSQDALIAYAGLAQTAVLAKGQSFTIGEGKSILCDGTASTRADLSLLALFGQANPSGTKTWLDNDKVATSLTGAELVQLATLAGSWIADVYAALAQIEASITASSPTITTTAQIDAFAWPTT